MIYFFFFIGALTSKSYSFNSRKWELEIYDSYDFFDLYGNLINICLKDLKIVKIIPKLTLNNENWITDKIRFFFDSLIYQVVYKPYLISNYTKYRLINLNDIYKYFFFFNSLFFKFSFSNILLNLYIFFEEMFNFFFLYKLKNFSSLFFMNLFFNISLFNMNNKFVNKFFDHLLFDNFLDIKNNLNTISLLILGFINIRYENPLIFYFFFKRINLNNLSLYSFGNFYSSNINYKILGTNVKDLINFFNFFKFSKTQINSIFLKKNKILILLGLILVVRVEFYYILVLLFSLKKWFFSIKNVLIFIKFIFFYQYDLLINKIGYNNNYFNKLNLFFFGKVNLLKFNNYLTFEKSIIFFYQIPSYVIIFNIFTFNLILKISSFFFKNNLFILHLYQYKLSLKVKNLFIMPITFLYESDLLSLNIYNSYLISKFIYAPKIITQLDSISNLILYEYIFNISFSYDFLNKKKNILFNLFYNKTFFFDFFFYLKVLCFNNYMYYLSIYYGVTYQISEIFFFFLYIYKYYYLKFNVIYYFFYNFYFTNAVMNYSMAMNLSFYRFFNFFNFYKK